MKIQVLVQGEVTIYEGDYAAPQDSTDAYITMCEAADTLTEAWGECELVSYSAALGYRVLTFIDEVGGLVVVTFQI